MVYFCADDYGLCDKASMHIQQCIDEGALNKVSVFPNLDWIDLDEIVRNKDVRAGLHLNLVEGRCMADAEELDLITYENGDFKHTFIGLLILNLFHRKKLEAQAYKEIKAQVLFWRNVLPEDVPFCIDSHQHTHMIPAVFKALVNVLSDEEIDLEYMRIPIEPISPYIKTPSLYFTYKAVNIIKQWLLKFLWMFNKRQAKKHSIPIPYFFGILFSGNLDEERVNKILPKYIKLAEKDSRDIEVLFHPGYIDAQGFDTNEKNIIFDGFYFSEDRKTEFDSVMKISTKEVYSDAVY